MGNPSNRNFTGVTSEKKRSDLALEIASNAAYSRAATNKSEDFSFEEKQIMVERWRQKHQRAGLLITDCQLPNHPTITKTQCANYLMGVAEHTADLEERMAMPLACKKCRHRGTHKAFSVRAVKVSTQPKRVTILKLNGYITIPQAAKLLHLHETTVRQLCREGKLFGRKVKTSKGSDRWMVKETEIERFKSMGG